MHGTTREESSPCSPWQTSVYASTCGCAVAGHAAADRLRGHPSWALNCVGTRRARDGRGFGCCRRCAVARDARALSWWLPCFGTNQESVRAARWSADIDRVCAIACQHRLCIVVGFFERGGDNEIYNSAMAVDSDGTVASIYRKTHLFGPAEEAAFTPGNELGQVFRLCGGVACALLICCTPNEIETTAHPCVSVLWSPCWDR